MFLLFWTKAYGRKYWKKNLKGTTIVINFLKVVVNDEEATLFLVCAS